jgi:CBS domain-containing protein
MTGNLPLTIPADLRQFQRLETWMANIGEICNREVIVTTADTTVAAAAKLMRQYHVGTVVVCERTNGEKRIPLGIVTDRDIVVEVVAPELRADTITVGDIMEPELVTAVETEGVVQTLEIMRHRGVRRLPIVGVEGHLVGIVAIDDLLGVIAEELTDIAKITAREQNREAARRK